MKQILHTLASISILALSYDANADVHVHDSAELYVMQQDQQWQFQFVIPAINALGFEHLPESKADINKVKALAKQLQTANFALELTPHCQQINRSDNLAKYSKAAQSHGHENHDEHLDVKLEYTYQCTQGVDKLKVSLLDSLTSLSSISVQWILTSTQGAKTIESSNSVVAFGP